MNFIFDPSLVLYLPLHELDGSSFMSRDAYGHLCAVTGALWTSQGRSFDGLDDVIDCGDAPALDTDSDITLEAWVKLVTLQNSVLAAKRINATNGYILGYEANTDGFFIQAIDAGNSYTSKTASLATANVWYHVLGTYTQTGNVRKLYVNAVDVSHDTGAEFGIPTAESLTLSKRNGQNDLPFGGLIGEIRVYNHAFPFVEVQHNYLATKWRYR